MKRILPLLLLLALLPITAKAHPGSLDANGGHWDREAGTYHYHDGLNTTDSGSDSSQSYDFNSQYDSGYDDGYDYGRTRGYASGHDEGWKEGYQYGLEAGRKEGNSTASKAKWKAYAISTVCFAIIFWIFKKGWNTESEILKGEIQANSEFISKLKEEKESLQKDLNSRDSQTEQKLSQLKKLMDIETGSHCWDFHTRLKTFYGSRYMYDMAGAPSNAYLDKSYLPHTRNVEMNGRDDQYTFYLSTTKGHLLKYHKASCRYANRYFKVNAYIIRRSEKFSKCLVCNPVLPPTAWVDNLKELYQFIDKYEKPIEAEAVPLAGPNVRYSLRERND